MKEDRNYRGSSAEVRRIERRERFLDAARIVFGGRGFHSATVRVLCEQAGLTERYFYESFENTEALFIAMHRRTSERILTELTTAADGQSGDPDAALRAIVSAYFAGIQRDPVSAKLFAIDAGYISGAAREVCAAWRGAFGLLIAQTLCRQSSMPAQILRSAVVRALLGIGVDWMEDGFSTPLSEIVDAGVRISSTIGGAKPQPARPAV